MKPKPVAGQQIFNLPCGNVARGLKDEDRKLVPFTVTKVGNKYFWATDSRFVQIVDGKPQCGCRTTKFDIQTWYEVSEYSPCHQLYETEQLWKDDQERSRLWTKIKDLTDYYTCKSSCYSLETLRAVVDLLITDRQKEQQNASA